ncbi:hypothetical protein ACJQWK_06327 [Exserohilum turcicum]
MATNTMAHSRPSIDSDRIDKEPRLTQTTTNVSLSPQLFERLCLDSMRANANTHVRTTQYANSVPLGFLGFVISTFTFSMVLMGWGGARGLEAVVGIFFFTGPLLLTLSTIFNWIQGQFFPMMVTGLFSVYWLSFGLLQLPSLGLAGAYSKNGNAAEGALSHEMNAVLAIYCVVWGFAMATFALFTIRMNLAFVTLFVLGAVATWILGGAYWALANGQFSKSMMLQKMGGAILFVIAVLGWYILVAIMLVEMGWSITLPLGDLSRYWEKRDVELGAVETEKND